MNEDELLSELGSIRRLLDEVEPQEAEDRLKILIGAADGALLREQQKEIRDVAARFLPKRRRAVLDVLGDRLEAKSPATALTQRALDDLAQYVRASLSDLSEYHIFQWSTSYREAIDAIYSRSIDAAPDQVARDSVASMLLEEFSNHSKEVFSKGYQYKVETSSADVAERIAVSGLQRFTELPIESYAVSHAKTDTPAKALALRAVCSAILTGILEGYGRTHFGGLNYGWNLLPQYPETWVNYVGFMRAANLDRLTSQATNDALRKGLAETVHPVLDGLDRLLTSRSFAVVCLPVLAEYSAQDWKLSLSLSLPKSARTERFLVVECYLSQSHVSQQHLEQSLNSGASLIAGPLRPDLHEWVMGHKGLRNLVVNTSPHATARPDGPVHLVRNALAAAVERAVGASVPAAPLSYNFARDFPLHNPFLSKYFRVARPSVRELLRGFEFRNGIRLWCSVRRSGKTTACFDLGSTAGNTVVVPQTCARTQEYLNSTLLYDAICRAIETGSPVSQDFLQNTVDAYKGSIFKGTRSILIVDEYESIFERLAAAAIRDREAQYTIVQPILDQMVGFSRDNLLVLVGQRPDAHFVVMEQNQLSAYVEQDAFPLFDHKPYSRSSEFHELLGLLFTQRIGLSDGFVDAFYEETAGHPYLTVNVAVEFLDWLIAKKRSALSLELEPEDFSAFSAERLDTRRLLGSREYKFFRNVAKEALSTQGQTSTPWLHCVYRVLREICRREPESLSVTRQGYFELCDEIGVEDKFGYEPESLLADAVMANFLTDDGRSVAPAARVLGRLSAAVAAG